VLKGNDLPDFCVEVKNVTLVEEGLARFPDAVTERGRKHLVELSKAVAEGKRAAMIYVVQRGDGFQFSPARDIDPEYASALKKAAKAGVEVYALAAEVTETGVYAIGLLPCSF
jgi:sugar fermentation stimulation protein A